MMLKQEKNKIIMAVFSLIFIIFITTIVGACNEKRVITDTLNREVSLEKSIDSIITVFPPTTAMVLAIDGAENLKAVDCGSINNQVLKAIYPQFEQVANIGHQFKGINKEEILSFDPDIVFASNWRRNQTMEEHESCFPIVYVNVENIDTFKESFLVMGKALDKEERTRDLLLFYNQKMEKIMQAANSIPLNERPKVYMTSHGTFNTCTKNSIENYILELCGGINVANGLEDELSPGGLYPEIGVEQLLKWNPDIILVNSYCSSKSINEIYNNPVLEDINAVKNRQVYKMPDFISCWYIAVPESILGMEWTLYKLYPEKIDFNIKDEIKEFYKKFYNYDISDKEINLFL